MQSARGARTVDSFVRDFVAFTNKRLIAVNVQGLTGKKRDYSSLPYNKIQAWSVDTPGPLILTPNSSCGSPGWERSILMRSIAVNALAAAVLVTGCLGPEQRTPPGSSPTVALNEEVHDGGWPSQ